MEELAELRFLSSEADPDTSTIVRFAPRASSSTTPHERSFDRSQMDDDPECRALVKRQGRHAASVQTGVVDTTRSAVRSRTTGDHAPRSHTRIENVVDSARVSISYL